VRNGVPRAVLDTNVLVSALISPAGPSARLLIELRAGAFELVVSPMLLTELREVLARAKFRRYVSESDIDAYVDLIRRESIVLPDPEPASEPLSADPDDEYLIDLAREARADALVSGDAHLLDLRDELPTMTPREFLEIIVGH
jgi:putative PIN family toxin of toxin-antitoxin system